MTTTTLPGGSSIAWLIGSRCRWQIKMATLQVVTMAKKLSRSPAYGLIYYQGIFLELMDRLSAAEMCKACDKKGLGFSSRIPLSFFADVIFILSKLPYDA